ncbi:hypothetical protein BH11ACT2_BH11ACT2_16190 [soil metagenome]
MARRSKTDAAPALPIITADQVHALREQRGLARVEVYPVPEVQSPDSPSSVMRSLPQGLELSFPAATQIVPRGQWRLVIDKGAPVTVTGAGVIGRAPDAAPGRQTVTISDPGRSLSRNHLGFERDARGRLFVFDLNSGNGTEIVTADGARTECVPARRYSVADGDTVLIGNFGVVIRAD